MSLLIIIKNIMLTENIKELHGVSGSYKTIFAGFHTSFEEQSLCHDRHILHIKKTHYLTNLKC